ncbi:MAG: medium chain dehydrogenase/reductase family protein [Myxococcota bacterium]
MASKPLGENADQGYRRVVISKYGGPEVLQLIHEPALPEPGPGEVRIRVRATSVAFTDTLIRRGLYPATRRQPMPLTPGYDVVGVIDARGEGATRFAVGEMVADLTATGGYAEFICLPEDRLTPVPEGVDPAEAVAMILSGITAYQMLHRIAQVQPGQRVLIHGAGGAVGSALLQLGKSMNLTMFATASASKHDLLTAQGAVPIDYTRENAEDVIRATGQGLDAAFDATTAGSFHRSFSLLRRGGTLVWYGMMLDRVPLWRKLLTPLLLGLVMVRGLVSPSKMLRFYSIAALRKAHPDWFRDDLSALLQRLAEGKVTPVIERRIDLSEVQQAHRDIEAARVRGKLVITMNEP